MSHSLPPEMPSRTDHAGTDDDRVETTRRADGFTVVELQAIRDQYEDRLRASEAQREEVEFRARQALARLGDALEALRAAVGDDAAILRRPLAGPPRARA